ncbi:WbqC family protein [Alteromonas sp. ASW11-130]|uniref:WbqC family protein n=1 Tax=Alteromonas sp. ASW11-130 TaxID=3015775 RepID=UPI0022427857|nr:WbqC family protein [Alteromonas sp. ASW11-130]MCW8090348.1 WbqC family protein [Alteromonas sp. ASW11-130]
MILAAFQPYLLPYIGYFKLIESADVFVVLDNVSFRKRSFINRNSVLLDEREYRFTVPVQKVSQNRKINEHEYLNDGGLVKLLQRAYPNSSKFPQLTRHLKDLNKCSVNTSITKNVAEVNTACIKELLSILKIDTEVVSSSSLNLNNTTGSKRIINICHHFGASKYINPVGGKELYNSDDFAAAGITLSLQNFHESLSPRECLSIVDLLFEFGVGATIKRLEEL